MIKVESESSVTLDIIRILVIAVCLPLYFLLISLVAFITLPLYLPAKFINKITRNKVRQNQSNQDRYRTNLFPGVALRDYCFFCLDRK